jgi:hypothetical protein
MPENSTFSGIFHVQPTLPERMIPGHHVGVCLSGDMPGKAKAKGHRLAAPDSPVTLEMARSSFRVGVLTCLTLLPLRSCRLRW